jgi:hypothetical protein
MCAAYAADACPYSLRAASLTLDIGEGRGDFNSSLVRRLVYNGSQKATRTLYHRTNELPEDKTLREISSAC